MLLEDMSQKRFQILPRVLLITGFLIPFLGASSVVILLVGILRVRLFGFIGRFDCESG